ncbi:hypothetical protein EJ08DRAFT_661753 [Tothia fuscella]|uniref:Uncharacterized protein n=1 Tax=Tothia fuscella TaxID=1048955 RepID=A0A9P4NPS6_9PEZI|nr:hypothetical protein EJ08DRAFT_661753 [Tothia fuscella]
MWFALLVQEEIRETEARFELAGPRNSSTRLGPRKECSRAPLGSCVCGTCKHARHMIAKVLLAPHGHLLPTGCCFIRQVGMAESQTERGRLKPAVRRKHRQARPDNVADRASPSRGWWTVADSTEQRKQQEAGTKKSRTFISVAKLKRQCSKEVNDPEEQEIKNKPHDDKSKAGLDGERRRASQVDVVVREWEEKRLTLARYFRVLK